MIVYINPLNLGSYAGRTFLEFLTLENGTDRLSRNVGTELTLNAV
jgi:hypothetical protein